MASDLDWRCDGQNFGLPRSSVTCGLSFPHKLIVCTIESTPTQKLFNFFLKDFWPIFSQFAKSTESTSLMYTQIDNVYKDLWQVEGNDIHLALRKPSRHKQWYTYGCIKRTGYSVGGGGPVSFLWKLLCGTWSGSTFDWKSHNRYAVVTDCQLRLPALASASVCVSFTWAEEGK